MSKPASPWSMVGRIMGSSRLRSPSRRHKGKETEPVAEVALDKENRDLAVTSATKGKDPLPAADPVKDHDSASHKSLSDENQYMEITRPTTPAEHEQEWTQVVETQYLHPLHPSITTGSEDASTGLEDDMVDVMSQSVSSKFLDQEARASQNVEHLDAELRRKEAEILALENQKRELESRLENALHSLESTEEEKRELYQENRRQVDRLQVVENNARILQSDNEEMTRSLNALKGEAAIALQRVRQLEEDLGERAQRTRSMEGRLNTMEKAEAEKIEQLHNAQKTIQELEHRVEHLSQESDKREKRIQRIQEDNVDAHERLDATVAKLVAAVRNSKAVEDERHRLADELREKEEMLKGLRIMQGTPLQNPNHRLLETLERRNRMLADQIRLQSEQLRQQSLSRFNQVSQDTERSIKEEISGGIIGMVDRLNSEIFQAAAHMADSLVFESRNDWTTPEMEGIHERASLTMGRPMVLAMQAVSARIDAGEITLPRQIALQACMVSCCAKIISSWYPGHWEYGDFLETLYSRIQGSEGKIAVKWRALTRSQLGQSSGRQVQSEIMEFVFQNLVDTLIVCGWIEVESTRRRKLADFQERLTLVVWLALRLNASIGDELEALLVHPTEQFNPETMEDAYEGEELDRWEDTVVCTTDIGLKMATRGIILKPKVVLRSTIAEETGHDGFE
ncbi:hypothetical protein Hypma_012283 [Hypsizygus marmoreus]|uniref:Uncharacterized protein n=1 Tax=Hypsizygus marmoreus TaxID=39966 RepID=A0A369JH50_HYPMA|nr:hypothetical protein Hypma_012283 [Hypsizygus marmoreus]